MYGLSDKVYNEILSVVHKYEGVAEFQIFGSRAKGNYKYNSDIDIAVFGDLTDKQIRNIREDFYLLNIIYAIDVVIVNDNLRKEMKESILKEGIKLDVSEYSKTEEINYKGEILTLEDGTASELRIFKLKRDAYQKALIKLKELLTIKLDDSIIKEHSLIEEGIIDGTIQRFEFTFELAWKTIKDFLSYAGVPEKYGFPRDVIQAGFKAGIIRDGDTWIEMLDARNKLSHRYDYCDSRRLYKEIKSTYYKLLEDLNSEFNKVY